MAPALAPALAGNGNGAQAERNSNDPSSWGKVAVTSHALRLRQEIQTLPRQIRLRMAVLSAGISPAFIFNARAKSLRNARLRLRCHSRLMAWRLLAQRLNKQHPYAAARRARAFAGVMLCQSPHNVVGQPT
jgi:hypothetical protein